LAGEYNVLMGFALVPGVWFFGEQLPMNAMTGAGVVVAVGLVALWHSARRAMPQ